MSYRNTIILFSLIGIFFFFINTSMVAAKEYPYVYQIDIKTENNVGLDLRELRDSSARSTVDIKTNIELPILNNPLLYLTKKKIGPKNTLKFKADVTNDDRENQRDLNFKIIIVNPEGTIRGTYEFNDLLDNGNLRIENGELVSGDRITFNSISYEIPSNAIGGKWSVYSIVYQEGEDNSESTPVALSLEPQLSFFVEYSWQKWIPIGLFVILAVIGSTLGAIIIKDDSARVLVSICIGILLFIVS